MLNYLNVKEARPSDVGDGRSHLLASMNHIHSESVDSISSDIIAINSRDQNLSLMIIHKQAANHLFLSTLLYLTIFHRNNLTMTMHVIKKMFLEIKFQKKVPIDKEKLALSGILKLLQVS